MDKKALIAIGVIAVLGIGTYAVIISRNKNKTTDDRTNSGTNPPPTPTTPPSKTNESLLCKYFKIGCGLSTRIDL